MNEKINISYIKFLASVAALGGFLFGYDTAVISGTIAQISHQFDLSTIEQGWYVGCALIGSIVGVSMGGLLGDKYGRKRTLFIAATLFFISAVFCAVSPDLDQLVIARVIGGIGIGVVSIISPMYISELSVAEYRGRLVSLYQLAVTIGFLGAYLVNYALLKYSLTNAQHLENSWMKLIFCNEIWRGMLGVSGIPAVLFFFILFFIPESPRWLLLKNRQKQAELVLQRIYPSQKAAQRELDKIRSVLKGTGKMDWSLLMQSGVRKAVLIGAAIAILGQFMGVNAVLYYGPTIFERIGLSGDDSLFYQVIVGLVNVLTTILAVFIIDRVGRKKLVYFGVSGMVIFLLLIAFYFMFENSFSNMVILTCFLAYVFCCAISISAVIWVLLSEMYPNKIRAGAMSLAGLSLWIGTYLIGQLTPWLLENLGPAGTFLFFALMCMPYLFIVWKWIPETTGKSLEDIERHWLH